MNSFQIGLHNDVNYDLLFTMLDFTILSQTIAQVVWGDNKFFLTTLEEALRIITITKEFHAYHTILIDVVTKICKPWQVIPFR